MGFLAWHYTLGLQYYVASWLSIFDWVNHYFSLWLLLKTLFAPWKRLVRADNAPGFNLQRKFEEITFNIISRGIGAVVRLTLFWVGIVFLFFAALGGIAGLFFWILIPFFGFPVYLKYKKQPKIYLESLFEKHDAMNSTHLLETLFKSDPGDFVLTHCGIEYDDFLKNAAREKVQLSKIKPNSFENIIKILLENNVWSNEYLDKNKLTKNDLLLSASWWDQKRLEETDNTKDEFGRPPVAQELTFGYTPTLNKYSTDLSTPQSFTHRLIGRSQIVSRMERVLSSDNSVMLVGQPGVGKKTVVLEFAYRAVTGQFGSRLTYKRVLEFDYNALLSESIDLNQKKNKLSQILVEASAAGNIILVIRDLQRLINPEVESYDFTDILEEHLEKRRLKIIAIATNVEYERFIAPNLRLRKFLETVEVVPPNMDEAMQILIESAKNWEKNKNLTITVPSLRKILEESDRYISEVPFPEKALEILDAVISYVDQKDKNVVKVDDVNYVLAEKTGISFAALTKSDKEKLQNIEEIIHQRLIDQENAVGLIGKVLRSKTVGIVKEDRPMGSFLFLGPTGVGKTETAKVLAQVYYGSKESILRFDMAEYAGQEGLERLIGSISKNQPGLLSTSIKNRPASLLLLDEIEKANAEIYNLFLALLDEGHLTDAFGKKVSGRHLFVIATSNAAAEFIRQQVINGMKGSDLQESVVNYILEKKLFSPEFINRFDGVIVFEPLDKPELVKIAKLMFSDLAENLRSKNIYLSATDEAAEKLAEDGYEPAFGARPMRRIVNIEIGDLLGKAIIKDEIKGGDQIKILPGSARGEFVWERVD